MVDDQRSIASFMIRFTQHIYRDEDDAPQVQWRGQINHVQGDGQLTFTDLSEALAFIQRHLTQLTLDATAGEDKAEQEELLSKSYVIWEQFADAYSQMMFETMRQSIDQSEAIKTQMEDAVGMAMKTWQIPGAENADEIESKISGLQSQVQALAEKIALLEQQVNKE